MKCFYIDIGSSTIKTYKAIGNVIELVNEISIMFKNGFVPGIGISDDNFNTLINSFKPVARELGMNFENTKTFATGIWRDVSPAQLSEIKSRFENQIGVEFNVISHADEARYSAQATNMDYNGKKVLIINMGGKTTEVITVERDGTTSTRLLQIGVGDLISKFPGVNNPISDVSMDIMEQFVSERLADQDFDKDYDFALFMGELRFEKLSGYPLSENKMFNDVNHPSQLSLDDFIVGTNRIFFDMTMDELRGLMPSNPNWMMGARPGAILPLAIFRRADIKTIVPSDLNMINGVVKN